MLWHEGNYVMLVLGIVLNSGKGENVGMLLSVGSLGVLGIFSNKSQSLFCNFLL